MLFEPGLDQIIQLLLIEVVTLEFAVPLEELDLCAMGQLLEVCHVGIVMLLYLFNELCQDRISLLHLLLEVVIEVPVHLVNLPVLCGECRPGVVSQELELLFERFHFSVKGRLFG